MKNTLNKIGMCDAERDMLDVARRGRNSVMAIIVTLAAGYVALLLIGGPA